MNAQTSVCRRLWSERLLVQLTSQTVRGLRSVFPVDLLWICPFLKIRPDACIVGLESCPLTCILFLSTCSAGRDQLPTSFGRPQRDSRQGDGRQSKKVKGDQGEEHGQARQGLGRVEEERHEEEDDYAARAAAVASAAAKGYGRGRLGSSGVSRPGETGERESPAGNGDGEEERERGGGAEEEVPSFEGMSEKQKRLFQLKMKMVGVKFVFLTRRLVLDSCCDLLPAVCFALVPHQ